MDTNTKGAMKEQLIDKGAGQEIIELKAGKGPASTTVETDKINVAEQLKEAQANKKAHEKKAMDAWGTTGESKSFGLKGMIAFTLPRLWRGSCWNKFVFIFNISLVFVVKAVGVFVPIVMKEVIDSIVCSS